MSDSEQLAANLQNRKAEIHDEMAHIETYFRAAASRLSVLTKSLNESNIGNVDWTIFHKLVIDLPYKSRRYETLKIDLVSIEEHLSQCEIRG